MSNQIIRNYDIVQYGLYSFDRRNAASSRTCYKYHKRKKKSWWEYFRYIRGHCYTANNIVREISTMLYLVTLHLAIDSLWTFLMLRYYQLVLGDNLADPKGPLTTPILRQATAEASK